jgi:predicted nucleic acid-binding protein
MVGLSFKTYIEASKSKDALEYYKKLYGIDTPVVLAYHLNTKTQYGVDGAFKTIKDIEDMTWGQFVSAEIILSNTDSDRADMVLSLSKIVLRPIRESTFSNDDEAAEKKHEEDILNFDARSIMEEVESYISLRDDFIKKKYRGVFYMVNKDGKELLEDEVAGKDNAKDEFISQWYWYAITRSLAEDNIVINQDNNLTKIENALNTKMSLVAPEVAYKRHVQILEELERKKQEFKNI